MYHPKSYSSSSLIHSNSFDQGQSMEGDMETGNGGNNSKQRLRWTNELHERFVDAVAQLGGPDSESSSSSLSCVFCCSNLIRFYLIGKSFQTHLLLQELHLKVFLELWVFKTLPYIMSKVICRWLDNVYQLLCFFTRIRKFTLSKWFMQKYRLAKYLPDSSSDGRSSWVLTTLLCAFIYDLLRLKVKKGTRKNREICFLTWMDPRT